MEVVHRRERRTLLNTRDTTLPVWKITSTRRVDVAIQTDEAGAPSEFSSRRYPDEPKAKRAVLEKLAENAGLM